MSRRSTSSSRGYVGDVSAGSVYASGGGGGGTSNGTVRTAEGVRVPRPTGDPTGEGYARQYSAYVAAGGSTVGVAEPTYKPPEQIVAEKQISSGLISGYGRASQRAEYKAVEMFRPGAVRPSQPRVVEVTTREPITKEMPGKEPSWYEKAYAAVGAGMGYTLTLPKKAKALAATAIITLPKKAKALAATAIIKKPVQLLKEKAYEVLARKEEKEISILGPRIEEQQKRLEQDYQKYLKDLEKIQSKLQRAPGKTEAIFKVYPEYKIAREVRGRITEGERWAITYPKLEKRKQVLERDIYAYETARKGLEKYPDIVVKSLKYGGLDIEVGKAAAKSMVSMIPVVGVVPKIPTYTIKGITTPIIKPVIIKEVGKAMIKKPGETALQLALTYGVTKGLGKITPKTTVKVIPKGPLIIKPVSIIRPGVGIVKAKVISKGVREVYYGKKLFEVKPFTISRTLKLKVESFSLGMYKAKQVMALGKQPSISYVFTQTGKVKPFTMIQKGIIKSVSPVGKKITIPKLKAVEIATLQKALTKGKAQVMIYQAKGVTVKPLFKWQEFTLPKVRVDIRGLAISKEAGGKIYTFGLKSVSRARIVQPVIQKGFFKQPVMRWDVGGVKKPVSYAKFETPLVGKPAWLSTKVYRTISKGRGWERAYPLKETFTFEGLGEAKEFITRGRGWTFKRPITVPKTVRVMGEVTFVKPLEKVSFVEPGKLGGLRAPGFGSIIQARKGGIAVAGQPLIPRIMPKYQLFMPPSYAIPSPLISGVEVVPKRAGAFLLPPRLKEYQELRVSPMISTALVTRPLEVQKEAEKALTIPMPVVTVLPRQVSRGIQRGVSGQFPISMHAVGQVQEQALRQQLRTVQALRTVQMVRFGVPTISRVGVPTPPPTVFGLPSPQPWFKYAPKVQPVKIPRMKYGYAPQFAAIVLGVKGKVPKKGPLGYDPMQFRPIPKTSGLKPFKTKKKSWRY